MATVNELAYDLAELMGKPFDTAFVRQCAFNLNIYRGLILQQEMDRKKRIDPIYLQTIDCLALEWVDAGECCGVCTGTKVLRTVNKLPAPLSLMRGASFSYVGAIDNSEAFQQITLQRLEYTLLDRFPKLVKEYYYQDNRIYAVGSTGKIIKVQGIFEDPMAVAELQCETDTSGAACDPMEVDFPAPANIIARMWSAMLSQKFRFKTFDQDDDSNVNIKEA